MKEVEAIPAAPAVTPAPEGDGRGGWIQELDVQVGMWIALAAILGNVLYVLMTWDRPHRLALLVLLGACAPAAFVKPNIRLGGSVARAEAATIASSVVFVAVITAGCALDGGAASPLRVFFFISVAYATLAYPFTAAIGIVTSAIACYLGLTVAGGGALAPSVSTALAIGCVGAVGLRTTRREKRRRQELDARGESLRRSEQRFRAGFERTPVGTAMVTADGRFIEVNDALCRLLGRERSWLLAHSRSDLQNPGEPESGRIATLPAMAGALDYRQHERRYSRPDGVAVHALVGESAMRNPDGSLDGLYVHMVDITAVHRATELALRRTRQQTALVDISQMALESGPDAAFFTACVETMKEMLDVSFAEVTERLPNGRLHPRAGHGWSGADRALANSTATFGDYTLRLGRPVVVAATAIELRFDARSLLHSGAASGLCVPVPAPDGRAWGVLTVASGRAERFQVEDVDFMIALAGVLANGLGRQLAESRLHHASLHDALTGLPNRSLLLDRLEHSLRRRQRDAPSLAIMCLDLDDFKMVNEAFGHTLGDKLLRRVAERLERRLGPKDTLARLGGDDFVLLCDGLAGPEQAQARADHLLESFAKPFVLTDEDGEEIEYQTSASVGVAIAGNELSQDPQALLRDADTALYRAKADHSRIEFFDELSRTRVLHRIGITRDLRQALTDHQLQAAYQPIVSLADGSIRKAEALLRWTHPRRGKVSPADFIPIAEESDLILAIGKLVLGDVCKQVVRWDATPDPGLQGLQVAVNLSARQLLDPTLPEHILATLDGHGLARNRIVCEITETALMDDPARATETVNELAAAGVEISLDDFCTGYSALVHLRRFPLDTIKIDQVFTAGIPASVADSAIVRGLIEMAKAMDVTTVAEGIENGDQLKLLRELGCPLGQGSMLSSALAPDQFADFIRRGNGRVDLDLAANVP
jgi:diguanylate cyclase (GGDEF)-like protein/PAS domain S-box-containing protein